MGLYATITSLQSLCEGMKLTTTGDKSTLPGMLIDRAERRINSVLAKRYDLQSDYFQTTTSIPPMVREWAAMHAAGSLWIEKSRGGAGKESLARGQSLHKEVFADLKLLSENQLELLDSTGAIINDMSDTSSRVLCNTSGYTPTFDEGDELSWAPDPDKLEDIADAKG